MKIPSRDKRLKWLRGLRRLLPLQQQSTSLVERRIGRCKNNARATGIGGAVGVPTMDTRSNRKDFFNERAEVTRQLAEWDVREGNLQAGADGGVDGEGELTGDPVGRYAVPRDYDVRRRHIAQLDEVRNLRCKKDRLLMLNKLATSGKYDHITASWEEKHGAATGVDADESGGEEDEEVEELTTRSTLEAEQRFYDRIESRVMDLVRSRVLPYDWGPAALARRTDRSQQFITRIADDMTMVSRKPTACYAIGRVLLRVSQRRKEGAPLEEIMGELGGFDAPNIPQVDPESDEEPDNDVEADQAKVDSSADKALDPASVLGVGLVLSFKRGTPAVPTLYNLVGIDLKTYHFRALRLEKSGSDAASGSSHYRVTDDVITSLALSNKEVDLSSVKIYLGNVVESKSTFTIEVSGREVEQPRARPPVQNVAVLPKQAVPQNKLERRLLEIRQEAARNPFVPENNQHAKLLNRPLKRFAPPPAAPKVPAEKAAVEGSPAAKIRKPTVELSEREKRVLDKQKKDQHGKLERKWEVEGFSIKLVGDKTTAKNKGRVYDRYACRITDPEYQKLFLQLQARGTINLNCRARKNAARYYSFGKNEELLGEAWATLWCARTQYILDHCRSYIRHGGFKREGVAQKKLEYMRAIGPAVSTALAACAGDATKRDEMKKIYIISDEELERLDDAVRDTPGIYIRED
ncbi:unnamed protein product [Amoebophrya sp. A25]|nr:unnamed protein product [Amoebophrya sp. A25]|eukprot:GSA25T00007664001.1